MQINNKLTIPITTNTTVDKGSAHEVNKEFSDMLKQALHKVNDGLIESEKLASAYTVGKNVELHQVVLATEQANLALQLTLQIRNKVMESYQEIMRMQV